LKDNLIIEFFDIKFYWKKEIPVIKMTLKDSKKVRNDLPIKCISKNSKRICETGLKYYQHYLGRDAGNKIYEIRKALFDKRKLIKWYIEKFKPSDSDKLLSYVDIMSNNLKKSLHKFYSTPSEKLEKTKEKYKIRSEKWSKKIGKINSNKWKDLKWKNKEMKRRKDSKFYENLSVKMKDLYSNSEFKQKFMESINNKDRINKISQSSKDMWNKWKENDIEMYRYMINSMKSKSFQYKNKIKMNSIEYRMANLLDELNIKWKYEKIFHFNNISYVPDFYLSDFKVIIECYGNYWHANPDLFDSNKILYENIKAENKWKYDENKKNKFEENGYKFLHFWESTINENINLIKEQLENELY